ncbi:hypothetical protein YTPLAS72_11820 [Nitrospira sp.]|nr:hypothetical protein YTPLAS72_11820 [Nitrospira sp.]
MRALEAQLGLPSGFLEGLRTEDDWSFIIKIHALIEAAVSHLLCTALGNDRLIDVFSCLDLSDKRRGKMAFAGALSLLGKSDRRFVSSLSELRNTLVHDVKNVGFSLSKHVAAMDSSKFVTFVKGFDSFSVGGLVRLKGKDVSPDEVFRLEPKTAIWWSAMVTVAIIYQVKETERLRREAKDLRAECDSLIADRLRHLISPNVNK